MSFDELSLGANLIVFTLAGVVILATATRLTVVADQIADATGLGEALIGGILLGVSTSLSGVVTSVTAAVGGHPDLAASNAVGGIAAQTAFLALADIFHRRANLEHAAASLTNLNQSVLLIVLLCLPVLASLLPPVEVFSIHIVSFVMVGVYVFGVRLVEETERRPLWRPVGTRATHYDRADPDVLAQTSASALFVRFAGLAAVVGLAGWVIAGTGIAIAGKSGLGETVVGAVLTAVVTSMPELVTTIAAVRRGALQLAVGGILGGNTFDVLFLVAADAGYRPGSLYHAADPQYLFWIVSSILMTAILLLGLIRRQQHGPANIGFESVAILAIYGAVVAITIWTLN